MLSLSEAALLAFLARLATLGLFEHLPITPWRLREDRLLEEATHAGGDPLHLATMFGIGAQASLRYSTAVISTPNTPPP